MGITLAATPWVTRLALKANVLAVPRSRDVHETPPPRWGGIAIYLGIVASVLVTVSIRHVLTHGENGWNWHLVGVLLAGTFIGLVGLIDDVKELRAFHQIIGITLAAAILIAFNVRIEGLTNPFIAEKVGSYNPSRWIALS